MIWRLAWRNIWRNKRRTYITIASILFAVMSAVSMNSIQRGVWDNMLDSVVNAYFGYIQIQKKDYWDTRSINDAMEYKSDFKELTGDVEYIKGIAPRLESFALASHQQLTKSALVIGIDPSREHELTGLSERVVEGSYLAKADEAVLVAKGLAEELKLGIGDTLVLISQGFRGANAAGKYPIKGILDFPSPDLNKQLVYLPLKAAQWFYAADGRVTSLALQIDNKQAVQPTMQALESKLDTVAYDLMDWKAMMPDLVQAKAVDTAGNQIMLGILYLIITFGIFGTILMMTKEREYEFGILLSIGMKRQRLALLVWIETVLLGFLGALAGMLISLPIVLYFYYNPIPLSGDMGSAFENMGIDPVIMASTDPDLFYTQGILVFIITTLLALYPLFNIWKMRPVEAMRA